MRNPEPSSALTRSNCRAWAICLLLVFAGSASASEQDHPLVSAFSGSRQVERKVDNYNAYQRITGQTDGLNHSETLHGKLTRLKYRNPPDRSTLEIISNYRQALEAKGFKVDYHCDDGKSCAASGVGYKKQPGWNAINGMNVGSVKDVRYFTGKLEHEGTQTYISVAINPTITHLHVLEVQAMETGLVKVDAAVLTQALDRDGRVVVDGILFETDSARLQPASLSAIEAIAGVLKSNDKRLHIVGHTDNSGRFTHNLELSRARAQAVVDALKRDYGIAADRLQAHGVASLSPAASNASETGRSRNRRVEAVLQ